MTTPPEPALRGDPAGRSTRCENAGEPAHDKHGLRPPPEVGRREDFRAGQRVSFTDRSLPHRVGTIVRIDQQTASVDCDGHSSRVSFALLRFAVDT